MPRIKMQDAEDPDVKAFAHIKTLAQLRDAEDVCHRCPLYQNATQAVPGEGSSRADVMLVGEQPGDKEDLAGKPFVGPAGRMLDKALEDAGIARKATFVTNAVKHFKHEMRGKRRLHKRPNSYEIDRCNLWFRVERSIIKPDVIVALGATAARGVFGKPLTISRVRGQALTLADGTAALVTIHPSFLLRLPDEESKAREYRAFVADLRQVAHMLKDRAA